jgi:uncharacterized membrane protein YqjE
VRALYRKQTQFDLLLVQTMTVLYEAWGVYILPIYVYDKIFVFETYMIQSIYRKLIILHVIVCIRVYTLTIVTFGKNRSFFPFFFRKQQQYYHSRYMH